MPIGEIFLETAIAAILAFIAMGSNPFDCLNQIGANNLLIFKLHTYLR